MISSFLKIFQKDWFLPLSCLLIFTAVLFHPIYLQKKLPIPADTIVGLYHPWRDLFSNQFPSGIPFKNFLITDPVRQQFLWRQLSIDQLKNGQVPLWNPYSFSGTPLLANPQTQAFYPLNLLYILPLDFSIAWTIQVILQIILAGLFMWLYLRHLGLRPEAQAVGILAWIGSGFFVSWLEWNNVLHVILWLPLILMAIDKIVSSNHPWRWGVILSLSLTCSFFAGHPQIFFYVILTSFGYIFYQLKTTRLYSRLGIFLISYLSFIILVLPQLLPTLELIKLSARDIDQAIWQKPDWFLPWQNLVQLLAPDYFGNPATLNYFGVWNYQEFVSYVGILPVIFALLAVFTRWENRTKFFSVLLGLSLLFTLPNPIAKLPFTLNLPLISTAQPSRLIALINFSLAILAAVGVHRFVINQTTRRNLLVVIAILAGLFITLWYYSLSKQLVVSSRNLILPSIVFVIVSGILLSKIRLFILILFILTLTIFDLSRFALKFESFSSMEWLYPPTKSIEFLRARSQTEIFRIAAVDDRIMPPNFFMNYKLQSISGYDPLYLRRYGQYIGALESNSPNLKNQLPFNRIVTPKNINSPLFDLLNTKYVLSLEEITSPKFSLVSTEGQTKIYENITAYPRAFFVSRVTAVSSPEEVVARLVFSQKTLKSEAFVEGIDKNYSWPASQNELKVIRYSPNEIIINAKSKSDSFLFLGDSYYPSWKATIDDVLVKIYPTNLAFRGVFFPAGEHIVRFFL